MASVDSDVDMSPPTTPTRASPSISLLTSTPTQRSRTLRFRDTDSSQPVPFISGDPFTASNKIPPPEPSGNIMKTTEKAFDKARKLVADRERIAEEYAKSLDETTCYIQELGLGKDIGHLEKALAKVIKKFALGEDIMDSHKKPTGLAQSIHATAPGNSSISKPTYAQAMTSYQPNINTANLPSKPIILAPGQNTQHRRADNRIFVRLPEAHPSRDHHIHAVKAALFNKLGPEGKAVKAIQKVKSGIAIVPANEKHANQLIGKAELITSVLGGKVEKAEEWLTFVVDHVPMKLNSLDGLEFKITEESARKEVETVTGLVPTRVSWSKKTLANPGPTGTIVASFTKQTHPFRLFGTSSLARQIIKSPKPTQCPKCWGFHDARLCNFEQRCKQCSTLGHSVCQNIPRCTNCKGPHAADEIQCPARPIVRRGTIVSHSQGQLKKIRQAGLKAWLLANPANHGATQNTTLTQC